MKTQTITLRCTPDEHKQLSTMADQYGWTISKTSHEIIFGDFFTRLGSGIIEARSNIDAQANIESVMRRVKHD